MTSLVQSRRGRGYAIAALVIAPLWILLSIGALAIAFLNHTTADPASGSRSRAEAPQEQEPPASHDVFVNEPSVGDCLPRGYPQGQPESVRVAPCSQPHLEEVYAKFNLPKGRYPGDKKVQQRADSGCLQRFEQLWEPASKYPSWTCTT
jgi:hypothetical protein